jgi:DNA-binding response OmpR family regulator
VHNFLTKRVQRRLRGQLRTPAPFELPSWIIMAQSSAVASPPLRILIIDDDPTTLSTLSKLLGAHDFEAIEAVSGAVGVEMARREHPDLIICDVTMPRMDGYDVLRALKRDVQTAAIPFIFLSGNQEHDFVRRGMGLGADDYLTKPFDGRQLLESIAARVERQRVINHKLEDLRLSLARSVPNEFFTPLNAILGFSMLMLDSLRAGEEVSRDDLEDSMQSIHSAGEQLLRIASNYVLFTQLSAEASGQIAASSALTLPHADWEPEVARTVRKLALQRQRMKDLHYSFAPGVLAIRKDHLEKIVYEILDNAFKFSRLGQWVSVTGVAEQQQGRYVIRVIDHGGGMTEEQIASVAPMVQFERVRLVQPGLGLGLPIARMIAARHGGGIALSRNREDGMTIEIRLPLAPSDRVSDGVAIGSSSASATASSHSPISGTRSRACPP